MVRAVVGANWGDEGKGKITDMLGQESDIIVRFQGGANAGHTIVNDYGKFALHTLPSGIFYGHTTSIIGNGVALNIPVFFKEQHDKPCETGTHNSSQKDSGLHVKHKGTEFQSYEKLDKVCQVIDQNQSSQCQVPLFVSSSRQVIKPSDIQM